jgi:dihydrofolate reductase
MLPVSNRTLLSFAFGRSGESAGIRCYDVGRATRRHATMAKLIYFTPTSLDGYIADESGNYDWSTPDEATFAFMTELMRPIGTYLYGRKTYETMAVWETPEVIPGMSGTPGLLEFARIWQAADKVVYSRSRETLGGATPKTRLLREFDAQAVREWKARSPLDLTVGGPTLAAEAIRNGLVDEYHLMIVPTLLGRGRRVLLLPEGSERQIRLELLDERRFANGWVYLRYRAQTLD